MLICTPPLAVLRTVISCDTLMKADCATLASHRHSVTHLIWCISFSPAKACMNGVQFCCVWTSPVHSTSYYIALPTAVFSGPKEVWLNVGVLVSLHKECCLTTGLCCTGL